jgi:DNA-binding NtrC family response regulator
MQPPKLAAAHPSGADEPPREDERTLSRPLTGQPGTLVAVPRLLVTIERESGKPSMRSIELEGERVRVGSHPSNELILEDRQVSRFHCSLRVEEHGWLVSDAGSLNGTILNGVRIRDAFLPPAECELALGDSLLRVTPLSPEKVRRVPDTDHFGELRGAGIAMREVFSDLDRIARTDATVLLYGESGTGKELAAHELVRRSTRQHGPLVTIDCSAISANLIESELFGHVKGAFTGADRTRLGAFEAAHGGTIFLDEIGEMPLDMQSKLLRALEAREIRRAGENESRRVDVRVVAATNRNLEREVNRGRFREDLYFRLSVFTVRLPPLRERTADIPELVKVLLDRMGATESERLFTPLVYQDLARHDWPGNVRELRNYVERVVVLQETRGLRPNPESIDAELALPDDREPSLDAPFKVAKQQVVTKFERAYLKRLMASSSGNVSLASRTAKLDRMYLRRLLQRYGISRDPDGATVATDEDGPRRTAEDEKKP